MNELDTMLVTLQATPQNAADHAIAARYAPIILFDSAEPFLPLAAGYTIFHTDGQSPSFPRPISLTTPYGVAAMVIEYAIWWDWEIGHLYELEHAWVYLDQAGRVIHGEASSHGGYHSMWSGETLALIGEHLVLHSEPGKHAFAPDPGWYAPMQTPHQRAITRELAGISGVLVTALFTGKIARTPVDDTNTRTYLAQQAFTPAWDFAKQYTFTPESLVPWPALEEWIPKRVAWWVDHLADTITPNQRKALRIQQRPGILGGYYATIAGIERANQRNIDLIGVTLSLTADQVVVAAQAQIINHEEQPMLTIATSTLAELVQYTGDSPNQILTLDQLITIADQARIGLFIECTSRAVIAPALRQLQERDLLSACLIATPRPDWLQAIKAQAAQAITIYQTESSGPEILTIAKSCQADYIQLCWDVHEQDPAIHLAPSWVAEIQAAGLGVIGWYTEDPQIQAELRNAGIDGDCNLGPLAPIAKNHQQRNILAICIDFGDTLADEATEIKDANAITQRAALIPGTAQLIHTLRTRGYRLALVADGQPGTYRNVLSQHGIYDIFDAYAISEYLKSLKPNAENFVHGLTQLGIATEDYSRTIMFGNYLAADIKGANALGMISVWLDWSPRRPKIPADQSEIPAYTIHEPLALLDILDQLG